MTPHIETAIVLWLASGVVSALLARASWQLEFGRHPITIGEVIVVLMGSVAGPFLLLPAGVWFFCWALWGTGSGSSVQRWLQKPLFNHRSGPP